MKQPLINLNAPVSNKILSMFSFLKKAAVLAALVAGVQTSHGFAFLGPLNEAYQVAAIGYGWDSYSTGIPGGVVGYSDVGGPKNIAEEYRRNTPVLYYAMDANFLEYFGSNGVAAVDGAFAIMNSLTNVSQYSPDLSEFPLQSQRFNTEAQALMLTDLKSTTLHLILQQMGVAPPAQYTWTLKERLHLSPGPACPGNMLYFVIMRNFDPMPSALQTPQYSPYVNGLLYTYGIIEACTGPLLAYTIPYSTDANADTFTSVAEEPIWIGSGVGTGAGVPGVNSGGAGLKLGGYYTYLTRDDIGGLRYLIQTNNYNIESSGADTVQFVTNNIAQILTTLDLGLLLAQAATNSAAQLQVLYPGLIVTDTTSYFKVVSTPVVSLVTVPAPFSPAGSVQVVAVTNFVSSVVQFYGHNYGNIITNFFSRQSVYSQQTIAPGAPFSPAGSAPALVATTENIQTSVPAGDFFLLPPGLCDVKILNRNLLPTVIATTNTIFTITNSVAGGTSNQTSTVNLVTYFTNHVIVYLPINCPTDTVALRQGVERISFVRRDFDSLIGRFFAPVTNTYTLVALTNSALVKQVVQRAINQPDFLFTAADLAQGPEVGPAPHSDTVLRTIQYTQVSSNGLAGPGTIRSPSRFTFNKVGPLNYNLTAVILSQYVFNSDQSSAIQGLLWGSFDGTTNDPVVYPNGTSINNLINQLLIQVQPSSLPHGNSSTPYSFVYTNSTSGTVYTDTLSVTGGQSPYAWSLSPGSAGLPTGLSLSSGGQIAGTPSAVAGSRTYDFSVRVTDAGSRFVDVPFSITIDF